MPNNQEKRVALRYVEFHAYDGCNLNCRACSHFAPLFAGCAMPDTHDIVRSLEHLARLFSRVDTIRILGGEPLLNRELPEILCAARSIMPESSISLVTNGLLLEKWGESLAKTMAQQQIKLCITRYPVNGQSIRNSVPLFRAAGVEIGISPVTDRFRLFLTQQEQEGSFARCQVKNCTFLRDGKLYQCALSALITQYNRRFGTSFPETEGIDLATAISGEEVLRRLSNGCDLCRYCDDSDRLVAWRAADNMQSFDWLCE